MVDVFFMLNLSFNRWWSSILKLQRNEWHEAWNPIYIDCRSQSRDLIESIFWVFFFFSRKKYKNKCSHKYHCDKEKTRLRLARGHGWQQCFHSLLFISGNKFNLVKYFFLSLELKKKVTSVGRPGRTWRLKNTRESWKKLLSQNPFNAAKSSQLQLV